MIDDIGEEVASLGAVSRDVPEDLKVAFAPGVLGKRRIPMCKISWIMKATMLPLSLFVSIYSVFSANATIPPNCPTDDASIVTLPVGKGATIFGGRAKDEVVVVSFQYSRDQGQNWKWDGNPYEEWDPRTPGDDPAKKPYPQKTPGAFDPVPGSALTFKVYARGLQSIGTPAISQEFCINGVKHGQEPDGTPSLAIFVADPVNADSIIWFKLK